MLTGLDRLAADDFAALRGRSIVVLSNPTGLLSDLSHGVDAMVAAGLDVRGVFGPEHGFRGSAQAGLGEDDATDRRTGVPLFDTYQADVDALADLLRVCGAQTVVVDLQDVGVRFYTYIWSMYRLMLAALQVPGTTVMVLDRPNPLGRRRAGGLLADGFSSSVGYRSILHQHGLTIGELARVFAVVHLPAEPEGGHLDLEVVACSDWDEQTWHSTGRPWVAPSPNLPTADAALLYPGTGLFEAVTIADGRGTTRPFSLLGAPFVDHRWAEAVAAHQPSGVAVREAHFTALPVPFFETYPDQICGGLELHVTGPSEVDAGRLGLTLLVEAQRLYGAASGGFTHRGDDWGWLGLMTGDHRVRDTLLAGGGPDDVIEQWQPDQRQWAQMVESAGL